MWPTFLSRARLRCCFLGETTRETGKSGCNRNKGSVDFVSNDKARPTRGFGEDEVASSRGERA